MIISSLLFRIDSDAHKSHRMTILGKKPCRSDVWSSAIYSPLFYTVPVVYFNGRLRSNPSKALIHNRDCGILPPKISWASLPRLTTSVFRRAVCILPLRPGSHPTTCSSSSKPVARPLSGSLAHLTRL